MASVHSPRKFYCERADSPPSATGPFLSRVRRVRCLNIKPRRLDEEFASLQFRRDGSGGVRKNPWLSPDSTPSAPRAVKRRRFVALQVDGEDVGGLESAGGAEIRVRVRRATLRKLQDEFDDEAA